MSGSTANAVLAAEPLMDRRLTVNLTMSCAATAGRVSFALRRRGKLFPACLREPPVSPWVTSRPAWLS